MKLKVYLPLIVRVKWNSDVADFIPEAKRISLGQGRGRKLYEILIINLNPASQEQ